MYNVYARPSSPPPETSADCQSRLYAGYFVRMAEIETRKADKAELRFLWSGNESAPPHRRTEDLLYSSYSRLASLKVKVKVHTLDIAPVRSESPSQKRSGMARVLKGSHSFTCTPTRSSAIGMSHTCLCLPSRSWYSLSPANRHSAAACLLSSSSSSSSSS